MFAKTFWEFGNEMLSWCRSLQNPFEIDGNTLEGIKYLGLPSLFQGSCGEQQQRKIQSKFKFNDCGSMQNIFERSYHIYMNIVYNSKPCLL